MRHCFTIIVFSLLFINRWGLADEASSSRLATVYLDQGWNEDERIQFYFTTQGSQLIPYHWFLALEYAESDKPFKTDLRRFGFIPHAKDEQRNPDELPIGFVKDDNPRTMDYIIKKSYLGRDFEQEKFPVTNVWLGLTCAACHTTQLKYGDKMYRVDGGPALTDVEKFLEQLSEAVEATHTNPEKMTRFAKRVILKTGFNEVEQEALRKQVESYSGVLKQLLKRSRGTSPYGFGRLDAFGAILNEICETSLEIPENHYPADAPASYPFLWDTARLDWVQWNGSIGNPIARNVGEVLGVFGQFRLQPDPPAEQFRSTAHIVNLFELEQHVAKLKAPLWPTAFGRIDTTKAAFGEKLFEQNCSTCHVVPDKTSGRYPTRTIAGREYIKTNMIPAQEIGTDPVLVANFVKRLARPGALATNLPPEMAQMERVPRPALLSVAVGGILRRYIVESNLRPDMIAELTGHRPQGERPPNPGAYKARPLNGVWATAPYLHNGSVPNLYELLLPSSQRSKSFFVGGRTFDTHKVGFETSAVAESTEFKVANENGPIMGNLNIGHEGHGPGEKLGYTQTFDNGSWRDFTEEERWALVEYMKTLRSEGSSDPDDQDEADSDPPPTDNETSASNRACRPRRIWRGRLLRRR